MSSVRNVSRRHDESEGLYDLVGSVPNRRFCVLATITTVEFEMINQYYVPHFDFVTVLAKAIPSTRRRTLVREK